MLTKVVPTFQEMYEGLGAELPGPTQAIVDASNWIQDGGNLASVIGVVISIWLTNKMLHRYLRPLSQTEKCHRPAVAGCW